MNKTVKFSRYQLLESLAYLKQIQNNPKVIKTKDFSYFITRNLLSLRSHFESAASVYESLQNDEYRIYLEKQKAIELKWALRDDKGNLMLGPSGYPMLKNLEAQKKEMKQLMDDNKDMLLKHETITNEVMEILSIKEDYELFPINLAKIPDDVDVSPFNMFIEECLDLYQDEKDEASSQNIENKNEG